MAALIQTAVARGDRVLAAAGVSLARLGHPARILPELQAYTLDALVARQESYRQAQKLRKQALGRRDQADKFRRARPAPGEKQALRAAAAQMLADSCRLLQKSKWDADKR